MATVTSGRAYTDIDAFGCAIGLAEALTLAGCEAVPILPGPPNVSVPAHYHGHRCFRRDPAERSSVILVDISDPSHLAAFVRPRDVEAVFDHHFGFEAFWRDVGARVVIEPIGAAATLVWEEAVRLGVGKSLSIEAKALLAMAVLSNTVGLKSTSATPRDAQALSQLEAAAGLGQEWQAAYFEDVEDRTINDVTLALSTDTKAFELGPGVNVSIGQIELGSLINAKRALQAVIAPSSACPGIIVIPVRTAAITYLAFATPTLADDIQDRLGARIQMQRLGARFVALNGVILRKSLMKWLMDSQPRQDALRPQ